MRYTSMVDKDFDDNSGISDASLVGMAKNAWGNYNPDDLLDSISNGRTSADIAYRAYMSGYLTAVEQQVLKLEEEQA